MELIDFGVGISMPVRPEMREAAEQFLHTILGCRETLRSDSYTCFRFPGGHVIGLTSEVTAPTEEEYERSTWLEIVSENFSSTVERIKKFGVREVEGGMKDAFFFNIPGGAVFRLISRETATRLSQLT